MPILRSCFLAGAACLALSAVPAEAQRVGTTAAVNPASSGFAPGGASRILRLGDGVVFRERLSTSATGSLQVLLTDKSTLNVGPSASLVIDEFVYDPNAGIGRTALSLARGLLRYVGGENSHSGNASIRTPEAALGVRGGTATVERRGELTRVAAGVGIVTVTATGSGETVTLRPGYAVTVGPNGIVEDFSRVRPGEVSRSLALTTSRPGQTGGARRIPTERLAAGYGVGEGAVATAACTGGSPTFPGARSSRCYGQGLDLERQADEVVRSGLQLGRERPVTPFYVPPPATVRPPYVP